MRTLFLSAICVLAMCLAAQAADVETKHHEMLYPVVRVTVGSGGGSGTILYSEDRGDGCQTYVLTNHHVIAGAIHVKEEWSSLLQSDVKREANDRVKVEVFCYSEGSRQDKCDSYRAEIVAHDKKHDLAILKLETTRQIEHVATMLPKDGQVVIFTDIWAVGCSLLHPPVVTEGMVNYLDDVIDRKVYWMGSAQIIFGNSGGAVFTEVEGHYYFLGVPSRVAGTWGQVVTHMGWFVPIVRIRAWIQDEHLTFLVDPETKPSECFAERENLQRDAEVQLLHKKRGGAASTPTPAPAEKPAFRELVLPDEVD